ncbi:MAG: NosD domain-containing protein, partial [bacterium]
MSTRQKAIFGILMALGFGAYKPIWAETYVYGTITGDTIWNLAGSPYIATDTVYVSNGIKLTIEPGVIIRFATDTSLICYGTLNAIGTPLGTITFTSDQATHTTGHWKGIKLSGSGANGSKINYCDIGYAKQAVYLENASSITITYNYIHDNKGDNGTGWPPPPGGVGCGIYLSDSNNNIIATNTVKNNRGGQGGGGGWPSSPGGRGGNGCGIYLYFSGSNTLVANIIFNMEGGSGGNGDTGGDGYGGTGGIGCGIFLDNSNYNYSAFNILYGNKGGKGGDSPKYWESSGGKGGIGCGIYISNSHNNVLLQNYISKSERGERGVGDTANAGEASYGAFGNAYGIYIDPNSYNNTIAPSNTYNNEPIYYYYNQSGITIESQTLTLAGSGSTNLGRIVLINCLNFIIKNNSIFGGIGENGCTQGGQGEPGKQGNGIYLSSSTNTVISNNTISNNIGGKGGTVGEGSGIGGRGGTGTGVFIKDSSNIKLNNNTISNNIAGEGGGHGALGSTFGEGGEGVGILIINSRVEIKGNEVKTNKGGWGIPLGKGYGIYSISNSFSEIHCNNLLDNKNGDLTKGYGVYHDGSTGTISATYNWWGHSSGPEHPITNPSGQGDKVSDYVYYKPWIGSIMISPNSGPAGTIVTIEGAFFSTQTQISIDFGTYQTITTTMSSINGTFSTIFVINTQPPCTKLITVSDSKEIATAIFLLIPSPRITMVNPISGPTGTIVTIWGSGFGAFGSVRIDFGTHQTITITQSSPIGTFSTTFIVDTQPSCTKIITARDEEGNIATGFFKITGKIALVLPTSGSVGSIVTLQGVGFSSGKQITIDFGTHLTITTAISCVNGTFSITFVVDNQPPCTKMITARDFKETATTIFLLLPSPRITLLAPSSGLIGTMVTIAGSGFGPNTQINIAFGTNQNITSPISSEIGTFSTTFIVAT